ncbi:hypothetical protein CHUAL_004778 [Chamberlinius hualienensis]
MVYALILLCGLVALCHGGAPTLPGACPAFKPIDAIDSTKVIGDWIEHFHGNVGSDDIVSNCDRTKVTSSSEGVFELANTFTENGKKNSKTSTLTKVPENQAKFTVASAEIPKGITVEVSVLGTDYSNWLTSIFCVSDGTKHGYTVHVYSRENTISTADVEKAKETLSSRGITAELKSVDQSHC